MQSFAMQMGQEQTFTVGGSLEGRELVLPLQCMDKDAKSHLHIFEIISDSLRILRKNNSQAGGGRYDSEG